MPSYRFRARSARSCPVGGVTPAPADTSSPLRRRAEALAAAEPFPAPAREPEYCKVLHELRVHQIELELQSEALQEARAELEADLARFVELSELGPVGYFSVARDSGIRRLNLAAAGLLGLPSAEPGRRRLGAFVAPGSLPAFNRFLDQAFVPGEKPVCELDLLDPTGGEPLTVRMEGVRDRRADEVHVAVINITERKRAEDALREAKAEAERANQAKSRFLAAVSHDLRQPLAALGLYLDLLQRRFGGDESLPVAKMKDCMETLTEVLDDLLDLSKLEAGAVTPQPADFAVDTVLSRVISAQAPAARMKGLQLRYAPCAEFARTDSALFGRIVGNLVANAVRYTEKGGALVACRKRQGRHWVEVWDTGVGIPAERIGEIFEEFRQLGNSHRDRSKGSGLGLAIVARAAALLDLQLRVRSRPGRGSMFAVELPAGRQVAAAPSAPTATRALRVALAEDNPAVLNALTWSLQALGHEVVGACSGAKLIDGLAGRAPDLVLADYRLSERETGLDVIGAVREAFGAGVPAIVVTGDTDPGFVRSMVQRGVAVQHKPLSLDVLKRRIAEAVGIH